MSGSPLIEMPADCVHRARDFSWAGCLCCPGIFASNGALRSTMLAVTRAGLALVRGSLPGRFVDSVLGFADSFFCRAHHLVGDAFGLKPLVADGLADGLLRRAHRLLRRAFDTFLAHDLILG